MVVLVLCFFIYSYSLSNLNNESHITSTKEDGLRELGRANFIANSGYEWTGKDELNYAIYLAKLKNSEE